jgi:hypothetical protein
MEKSMTMANFENPTNDYHSIGLLIQDGFIVFTASFRANDIYHYKSLGAKFVVQQGGRH